MIWAQNKYDSLINYKIKQGNIFWSSHGILLFSILKKINFGGFVKQEIKLAAPK